MDFEQQARDFLTALGDFERAYNPDTDSWVPKEAEQALVEVLEATYKAGQESQTMWLMVGGGRLTQESVDKLNQYIMRARQGREPVSMGEVVARDMDRLVMEDGTALDMSKAKVDVTATDEQKERGECEVEITLPPLKRQGRPQPKRFGEEPETVTVSIPIDVAEDWLHGADRPEIQDIIQEALERR